MFLNCWTLTLLRRYASVMSLSSVFRLRSAMMKSDASAVRVRMRASIRGDVWFRPSSSDMDTLEEVVFKKVYENVATHLPNCETIVDLGANIGLASRYFISKWPKCHVFAVEPVIETCRVLELNLEAVAGGRNRWIRAAAWEDECRLTVRATHEADRFDGYRVSTDSGSDGQEVVGLSVNQIIDLSGFLKVDLLKVDIEGAESSLFRGNLGWLKRVNAIAIEFHGDSRQECAFDAKVATGGFVVVHDGTHTVLAVRKSSP